MTVWNRQDWTWRVTAIAGLLFVIMFIVAIYFLITHIPFGRPSADMPDYYPWNASDTKFITICCAAMLALWLPMLKWRWGAWPWIVLWAAAALLSFVYAITESLLLLFLTAGICSSQLWVVSKALRPAEFSGRIGDLALWHRAGLGWLLLAGCGAAAILAPLAFTLVMFLTPPEGDFLDIASIMNGAKLLSAATFAVVAGLLWVALATRGRSWLFWLLIWAFSLLGGLVTLVADISPQGTAIPIFFVVLAMSQIWVALKARQLQSGQVGLVTH